MTSPQSCLTCLKPLQLPGKPNGEGFTVDIDLIEVLSPLGQKYPRCSKNHMNCASCLRTYFLKEGWKVNISCPNCPELLLEKDYLFLTGGICVGCHNIRSLNSVCKSDSHYMCDICYQKLMDAERSKENFTEMSNEVACYVSECSIKKPLVLKEIGFKCYCCKQRSSLFQVSLCKRVCDVCIKKQFDLDDPPIDATCLVHPLDKSCITKLSSVIVSIGERCQICYERTKDRSYCDKHSVCSSCMKCYLETDIHLKPYYHTFNCPIPSCQTKIGYDDVRILVGIKFNKWIQNINKGFCCQNYECSRRKSNEDNNFVFASVTEMCCKGCLNTICVVCREQQLDLEGGDHQCTSQENQQILQLLRDPMSNLRPCPRCLSLIEKIEGCNHMTCDGALGCGWEFCWLCLVPYSTHNTCLGDRALKKYIPQKIKTRPSLFSKMRLTLACFGN